MNKQSSFELFRALAIIAVVFGHFTSTTPFIPFLFLVIGETLLHYGVPLFFIISGYLLSMSFELLLEKHQSYKNAVKYFLYKRILRIYPAYIVSLLILSLIFQSEILDIIAHLLNIHNFFLEFDRSINDVYWSLAIEFQWYLLAPMIILYFIKSDFKAIIILPQKVKTTFSNSLFTSNL